MRSSVASRGFLSRVITGIRGDQRIRVPDATRNPLTTVVIKIIEEVFDKIAEDKSKSI